MKIIWVCFQQNNHHVDNISAKMSALRGKVSELERAAAQRKAKLDENSAFLQFNWKADVVESWIGTNTLNLLSFFTRAVSLQNIDFVFFYWRY